MNPRTHKILTMASEANMLVNEEDGSRYQILLVNWDDHTIQVADNMDEYELHVDNIDLETDTFYRMERMDPANF